MLALWTRCTIFFYAPFVNFKFNLISVLPLGLEISQRLHFLVGLSLTTFAKRDNFRQNVGILEKIRRKPTHFRLRIKVYVAITREPIVKYCNYEYRINYVLNFSWTKNYSHHDSMYMQKTGNNFVKQARTKTLYFGSPIKLITKRARKAISILS